MCLSLGKSLPSLGHLNQKDLLPRINGCACVLQAPNSVSLAIFCDRQFRPLTNARPKDQEMELALLWQIFSGTGFPNQFFNDSWVVGFWRADHGRHNVELGRRASRMAPAVLGSPGP